jgi:DNA-binding HxlR family transcriptional regulator
MAKRSYDQFCPLARALDLLGERWTLLIVRDLIGGPRRYTDLRNELDGVPSDILTRRLRDLETAGLVRRRELPPPSASTVYELTERGMELEPALLALARFGLGLLEGVPGPSAAPSPERLQLLLRALFDPAAAGPGRRTVALRSGELGIWVSFDGHGFETGDLREEPPAPIEATVAGQPAALYDTLVGRREAGEASAAGEISVDGDFGALTAMLAAFPGPSPAAA